MFFKTTYDICNLKRFWGEAIIKILVIDQVYSAKIM